MSTLYGREGGGLTMKGCAPSLSRLLASCAARVVRQRAPQPHSARGRRPRGRMHQTVNTRHPHSPPPLRPPY